MKRLSSILVVGMLVATVAACSGSTGGLGSVPTAAPIPSDEPGGPDLTPGPSSPASPSAEPVRGPGRHARRTGRRPPRVAAAAPTPAPSGTTIVRAYFVLGGEPGTRRSRPGPARGAQDHRRRTRGDERAPGRPDGRRIRATERSSSAIPDGTDLLGITIKNGVATVDLSTEFDSGGGSPRCSSASRRSSTR